MSQNDAAEVDELARAEAWKFVDTVLYPALTDGVNDGLWMCQVVVSAVFSFAGFHAALAESETIPADLLRVARHSAIAGWRNATGGDCPLDEGIN